MVRVKTRPEILAHLKEKLPGGQKGSSSEVEEARAGATRVLTVFFFLLPIFFWPLTPEFYQTGKLALAGLTVTLLALFLLPASIKEKCLSFPRSLLFPATFLLLLAVALASFFSIDSTGSLVGQFSNPHGSLLSYALYFLLFILIALFADDQFGLDKFIKAWTAGAGVLAMVTIFQYFNLFVLPTSYARQRFWSPTGSPTFTTIYLAASIVMSAYLVEVSKSGFRSIWFFAAAIQILALALLGNPAGWLALGAGLVVLAASLGKDLLADQNRPLRWLAAVGLIGLVLSTGSVRRLVLPGELVRLPQEVLLDWPASWAAATQILTSQPLLGTGPETFGLVYPQVKTRVPLSFANVNINYPRAGVELLQLVAGAGLLGLTAFGFLAFALLLTIKPKKESYPITPYLAASATTLLTAWFLAPAGVTTSALLFASLGLLATASFSGERLVIPWPELLVQYGSKIKEKRALPPAVVISAQALAIGAVVLLLGKYLLADLYYRRAIVAFQAGTGDKALASVDQALRFYPSRDEYSVGAATINLALASNLSRQPEATDSSSPTAQLINSFIINAVNNARRATALGPQRVANWENLAQVYTNLLTALPGAADNAVNAYQQAIRLDPTNHLLFINLGDLFLNTQRPQEAVVAYNQAIQLRTDLPAAYLGLARALRLNGETERAVQTYEQLLTFEFDQESEVYKLIQKEYEEAKAGLEADTAPEGGEETDQVLEELAVPSPEVPGAQPLVPREVKPVKPGY